MQLNMMNQQVPPQMAGQWMTPQMLQQQQHQYDLMQQQQMLLGAQQQAQMFYPQSQATAPLLFVPGKHMKRRPGTAGRKAQLNFGKKLGLAPNQVHMP